MPLKPGSGEFREVFNGVEFPMEDVETGKRIICQVEKDALLELAGADGSGRGARYYGHPQTFLDFRKEIEQEASRRYDRGDAMPAVDYVPGTSSESDRGAYFDSLWDRHDEDEEEEV